MKLMNKVKILKADSKKGFSLLAGINRPVSPNQVTKLAESVNLMGILRPVIVAKVPFIGPGLYIIDGQHLYHAIIRNNLDTPYLEINISSEENLVETIALLNASSKSWTMFDYLIAWKFINPDYKILEHYYNVYDFDVSQIAGVLTNRNEGGALVKTIKTGRIKILNQDAATELLDRMTDVMKIVPRTDRWTMKGFLKIYIEKYKMWGHRYNHEKFLEYLKNHKAEFSVISQDPNRIAELLETANKQI